MAPRNPCPPKIASVTARRSLLLAAPLGALAILGLAVGCGGKAGGVGSGTTSGGKSVSFARVQSIFVKYGCAGCHPGVNPSLDLRPGHAYGQIVGVRALEDPRLVRVVAGDPGRSFLYAKVAGDPKLGDIPAIGSRMPQGAPRMTQADIDALRDWILQGAKNASGRTVSPVVATPGSAGASPVGQEAAAARGTATIVGTVEDQRHRPLPHALVTILLRGADQPGGEEHYRVAATDAAGHYRLPHAPVGQYLLKAYASRSIYVSRIVALSDGETATIDFGLPQRVVPNPQVSAPQVTGQGSRTQLSMTVAGSSLDPNYVLAVNPRAGVVYELHRADGGAGRWSRTVAAAPAGPWIFLAVDHQCNVSNFVEASR